MTALGVAVWKSDTYLWFDSMGFSAFEISSFRTLGCDRNLPVAALCCIALAQVLCSVGYPVLVSKWTKCAEHQDNTALYCLWSSSMEYLVLSGERAWEHLCFWHICVWRRSHFWNSIGPAVRTLWSRKHGQRGLMAHHEVGRALSHPE